MPPTDRLSPPDIDAPVYGCAEVALVTGFTAGATVHVFANGNERIGTATPYIGWWHVPLVRPVTTSDSLTAIQEVGSDESFHTRIPVQVISHGHEIDPFLAPRVEGPLLQCQQSVTVRGTVRGAHVDVYDANDPTVPRPALGVAETPVDTVHVGTVKLTAGMNVIARQTVCETIKSPLSAPPITVQPLPPSLPTPQRRDPLVGSSVIIFDGLITGAEVDIFLGNTRVGGGIATSSSVIFSIPPVEPHHRHQAQQSLCQLKSDKSLEAKPVTTLSKPEIEEPICDGSTSVRATKLDFGATVKLIVNGRQLGQLTATGTSAVIVVGNQRILNSGDKVVVTQETPVITPVQSKEVTVSGAGAIARPRVLEGHPFFAPQPGEQAIPGPVFLRGVANDAGPGPTILVVLCGAQRMDVSIKPPGDRPPFSLTMTQKPEGHFVGSWDWSKIPLSSIAVGEYRAQIRAASPLHTINEDVSFFVIFNPAEVTTPARFGFNNTAIWFGTGNGALRSLPYTLHLQDNRVFGWAIGVVNGQISQFNSAGLLANAEHNRFAYDLSSHGTDTIDLLSQGEAQCADDACMLTALLRSVGIPAHPTTIDARLEFSDATWTFDTWVEARLAGSQGERWYALHSHHRHFARGPVTRRQAGTSWGEADRTANDMVVMAGENWVASEVGDSTMDVSYNWNTPCKRPNPQVQAAFWIENLTDNKPDTYWTKPFWECSPEYEPVVEIVLGLESVRPGQTIAAIITVTNRSANKQTGDLSVLLAESSIENKAFAELFEQVLTTTLIVPPQETVRIPVAVTLPSNICTDDSVFLTAVFGNDRAIAYIEIIPTIEVDVQVLPEVRVGDRVPLRIDLYNLARRQVSNVTLEVRTPFGMTIWEKTARYPSRLERVELGELGPGGTATVERVLIPEAVLTPGVIHLALTSAGECRRLTVPVVVYPAAGWRPSGGSAPSIAG